MLNLSVDVSKTIRLVEPRIIGINTNFLTDHSEMRKAGQGFTNALRRMGVRSLRYPGGEKSDEFFWSVPPWEQPQPTLALTGPGGRLSPMADFIENYTTFKHKPLDFDEFIALCRELDAEPVICVNYDSMYLPPVSEKGVAPTKAQLLEHAIAWVRYANIERGYGVKYWELGNESYLLGHNGAARAEDYARDFSEFSRAMKAIDPTIQLGANGPTDKDARGKADGEDGPGWWQTVLEIAAADLDFLAIHPYPCWKWGSYDYYIQHTPDFTQAASQACAALQAWAPGEAERIRLHVTETNAADWAASDHYPELTGWPLDNDLGHALVLFEILGQHLLHPQVDTAQVWNTRWVKPASKELWNALDERNEFNPTGHAIALWGRHLHERMAPTTSMAQVRVFASASDSGADLNVFLINKDLSLQPATLAFENYSPTWQGAWYLLHGAGPQDPAPIFSKVQDIQGERAEVQLDLPPVSISVLTLAALNAGDSS